MWRTGLRVSEVLELEWRDLDYQGEPATLVVCRSKTWKPRTVRLHGELVQLFTNWPANRSLRDKMVPMRTVLRHIGDGGQRPCRTSRLGPASGALGRTACATARRGIG